MVQKMACTYRSQVFLYLWQERTKILPWDFLDVQLLFFCWKDLSCASSFFHICCALSLILSMWIVEYELFVSKLILLVVQYFHSNSFGATVHYRHECSAGQCQSLSQQFLESEQCSRGRPLIAFSKEQLLFLLEHGFTQTSISKMLGYSAWTIKRKITYFQLDFFSTYSDVDAKLLDMMLQDIHRQFPNWGEKSICAHFNSIGLKIQKWHVWDSLKCVCPSAVKDCSLSARHSSLWISSALSK